MEVNVQLHAPVPLRPREKPPIQNVSEDGWDPESFRTLWGRERNLSPPPRIESHILSCPARSLITISTTCLFTMYPIMWYDYSILTSLDSRRKNYLLGCLRPNLFFLSFVSFVSVPTLLVFAYLFSFISFLNFLWLCSVTFLKQSPTIFEQYLITFVRPLVTSSLHNMH